MLLSSSNAVVNPEVNRKYPMYDCELNIKRKKAYYNLIFFDIVNRYSNQLVITLFENKYKIKYNSNQNLKMLQLDLLP